jgi:hypothetical protein
MVILNITERLCKCGLDLKLAQDSSQSMMGFCEHGDEPDQLNNNFSRDSAVWR